MKISFLIIISFMVLGIGLGAQNAFADTLCERRGDLKYVRGNASCPRRYLPVDPSALKVNNPYGNDIGQNIVTLYRNDPIAIGVQFSSHQYGLCFADSDGGVSNCGTDLKIIFASDSISNVRVPKFWAGPEGNNQGTVIDLGTVDDIEARYKSQVPAQYSMPPANWYSTLHASTANEVAFTFVNQVLTVIPLKESAALFSSQEIQYLEAKAGHLYVLRIFNDQGLELLAKLIVLSADGEKVTFRYGVIRSTPEKLSMTP